MDKRHPKINAEWGGLCWMFKACFFTKPMSILDCIQPKTGGCTMDWNAMTGDEKARHCSLCRKTVHHLSSMPRSQAEALVSSGRKDLCIAFSLTPEGKLLTLPEPGWLDRWRARLRGSLAFATGLFLAGCATSTPPVAATPAPVATQTPTLKDTKACPPEFMGDYGFYAVETGSLPPEKQGTKR